MLWKRLHRPTPSKQSIVLIVYKETVHIRIFVSVTCIQEQREHV